MIFRWPCGVSQAAEAPRNFCTIRTRQDPDFRLAIIFFNVNLYFSWKPESYQFIGNFLNAGIQEAHQKKRRRRAQRLTRDKSLDPGRRLDGDRQNWGKRRASQSVFWQNSSAFFGLRTPRLRSVNIRKRLTETVLSVGRQYWYTYNEGNWSIGWQTQL
jgi:hypothetical protein